jgi:hypothetical protein
VKKFELVYIKVEYFDCLPKLAATIFIDGIFQPPCSADDVTRLVAMLPTSVAM